MFGVLRDQDVAASQSDARNQNVGVGNEVAPSPQVGIYLSRLPAGCLVKWQDPVQSAKLFKSPLSVMGAHVPVPLHHFVIGDDRDVQQAIQVTLLPRLFDDRGRTLEERHQHVGVEEAGFHCDDFSSGSNRRPAK